MRENRKASVTAKPESGWHALEENEVARVLRADLDRGLTGQEAAARLAEFGPNKLTPKKSLNALQRLLREFNDPLIYILLIASVITVWIGEYVDSAVIFGVVLINAIVGFVQETKSENAINALSGLTPIFATVRRDGEVHKIPSEELVPGDVVLLAAGDRAPADLRLVQARNLQIDESALTGESAPVHKKVGRVSLDTILAERNNVVFGGTHITAGQGEGLVWATGDRTETGRIAWLVAEAVDLTTPLTRKIAQFTRQILYVILGFAFAFFAVGLYRGHPAEEMFLAAVALAVGAVPEGLPAAVTITLAIGVVRMARRRAIIRNLPAVETIGSATVICSDKTGTLTENQMTVREIFAGDEMFSVSGCGYSQDGKIESNGKPISVQHSAALRECLTAGLLCNESRLEIKNDRITVHGDPTEAALIVAALKGGLIGEELHLRHPRVDMIPFECQQMFRATLHHGPSHRLIYKVGAVEKLLERSVDALDQHGRLVPLNADAIKSAADEMARKGLRVLAMARRHVEATHEKLEHHHVASGLTFLGLQGMIDPPREEAAQAVKRCQLAGIAVKMITGDHLLTASTIARQIGLHDSRGEVVAVSGKDLAQVEGADLERIAERVSVFARIDPAEKLRLIKALQARGHVVAMTGDGVNDAPALKQADIGIAMGITGTDVAKGAADMILTDDNFATIEAAVEEGRGVFENLTKFILWTLPTNAGEALILVASIFFGFTLPALPTQLLWVNLTTAILLGMSLIFEPREANLMLRKPRNPKEPILTLPIFMRTGLVTLIMLAGAFGLFLWEQNQGATLSEARTVVINVIVMVEVAYLFSCRSLTAQTHSLGFFSNGWIFIGIAAMLAAQFLFTYSPLMNRLFHTAPINTDAWFRIVLVALGAWCFVSIEKWLRFGALGFLRAPGFQQELRHRQSHRTENQA